MLVTGILMVIGEPARELLAFSFWLKMFLVAIVTTRDRVGFSARVTKNESHWEDSLAKRGAQNLLQY